MEPKPIVELHSHIVGILLMNSCNTDNFLATTIICSLSALKCLFVLVFVSFFSGFEANFFLVL